MIKHPSTEQIDILVSLRGALNSGYTDIMIDSVSEDLEEALGINLVCCWEFEDMWGFGGDSEIFMAESGNLYRLPSTLYKYLYEGLD